MTCINAADVNPFVEAAKRVVAQITGIEVRRGHLSFKPKAEILYGVSIIIGIYGFLTGHFVPKPALVQETGVLEGVLAEV